MFSHRSIIDEQSHLVFSETPKRSLSYPSSRPKKDWLALHENAVSEKASSIKSSLPSTFQVPVYTSSVQSSLKASLKTSVKTSVKEPSVTSQQNQRLRRFELMSKLDNLKDMTGIQLPSFSDETTLEELEKMYTHYSRLVFVDRQVRTQKLYLIIFFVSIEYAAEYSDLPAKGVSQFLINNMGTLEQWLIIYAEKTYVPDAEELNIINVNPFYCLLREILKQVVSFVGVIVLGNKFNMNPETSSTILKAITTLFCESKYEYLLRILMSPNDEGEQIANIGDHEYQEAIMSLKGLWDQYGPYVKGLMSGGLGGLFGGGGATAEDVNSAPPRAPRPRARRR